MNGSSLLALSLSFERRQRTCFYPPEHAVVLEICTSEAGRLCGNDDLEWQLCVAELCPLDAWGLRPEDLVVLEEDVRVDDADATETSLDASNGGLHAAGKKRLPVFVESCADDYSR